jgi:hypothetical protein
MHLLLLMKLSRAGMACFDRNQAVPPIQKYASTSPHPSRCRLYGSLRLRRVKWLRPLWASQFGRTGGWASTFIVHGEASAADALRAKIGLELGWSASVPLLGQVKTL